MAKVPAGQVVLGCEEEQAGRQYSPVVSASVPIFP